MFSHVANLALFQQDVLIMDFLLLFLLHALLLLSFFLLITECLTDREIEWLKLRHERKERLKCQSIFIGFLCRVQCIFVSNTLKLVIIVREKKILNKIFVRHLEHRLSEYKRQSLFCDECWSYKTKNNDNNKKKCQKTFIILSKFDN